MRALFSLLLLFLTTTVVSAQTPAGTWNGTLEVGGTALSLVFHITPDAAGALTVTMDSPDQGAKGIPVSGAAMQGDSLILEIPQGGIRYAGRVEADLIRGTFKQGGAAFPLDLKRSVGAPKQVLRPQVPQPPFPYASEEVTFKNESAGITLAGTLTVPKAGENFPAVILISGSGPQNRDEELLGHKPFLMLADYLTRQGIAVLRYDDRGTATSGGVFTGATSADFAQDAEAALRYLRSRKEINSKKVGLAGHSEGGLIAPMIAAARPKEVAFLVLLAPPAVRGDSLLLLQQGLIAKASGMPEATVTEFVNANRGAFEIVLQNEDSTLLRRKMETYLAALTDTADLPAGTTKEAAIAAQIKSITEPWMQHFMRTDPAPFLQKVKCPVLALWGSNDLQVPPAQNEPALRAALAAGENKNVTATVLPGLNHLFQTSATGLPAEYAKIEETISPAALLEISNWLRATLAIKK